MSETLTHGSLFAGIGGFELAAKEAGIKTLWNCEIETYPRLVLSARFPDVTQYGDIRKLNGGDIAPVDIITFGSPCQSFSCAGARKGLNGESALFYEAVRVIKEMHKATNNTMPRYAIMENVLGIYSSKSDGKSDFREVLNELLKIKDEAVNVPLPKDGKFLTAGSIVADGSAQPGDGYSLAWRTLCASKFGVAQRRRRMFLVVDFAGQCAAKILSEPEGERRNFTPCYFKGQGPAGSPPQGAGSVADDSAQPIGAELGAASRLGGHFWEEKAGALKAHAGDNIASVVIANHANDSRYTECTESTNTLSSRCGTGGGNVDLCVEIKPLVLADRQHAAPVTEDYVGSLCATDYKGSPVLLEEKPYNICSDKSNSMLSPNPASGIYEAETSRTLDGNGGSPACNQGGTVIAIQGNVLNRKDCNGPSGIGFREDIGYTINTVDNGGAVCYAETVGALCASDYKGIRSQDIEENKAVVETFGNNGYGKWNDEVAALKSSGGDFPGGENMVVENRYAVRRLTPLECLSLQGLPDDHLDSIHILEPTAEQIEYWRSAFAELGKKKSDNQIKKWLANPYSDSNAYRAIGNSLCVSCALFVMRGIVENHEK